VLVGLSGAVVLTSAAGARRTDSAYARYLGASRAADLLISPQQSGFPRLYAAVARLPEVARIGTVVGLDTFVPGQPSGGLEMFVSADGMLGTDIERPKITAGRMADLTRPDEAVASQGLARALHLHPGSRLSVATAPSSAAGFDMAHVRRFTFTVTGIAVTRDDVVAVNALATQPRLIVGPAVLRSVDPSFYAFDGAFIALRPHASSAAFTRDAQAVAARLPEVGGPLFIADEHTQASQVEHAIRPQAAALAIFSLLAAVTALVVVGQVVSRQLQLAGADSAALQALGMSRRRVVAAALVEAGIVASLGAAIAVTGAALASPLMPIGPARIAELHPGAAVDPLIFGLGALAIIVVLVARVSWPAWRATSASATERAPADQWRPARGIGSVPATMGVTFALRTGRGRDAVPVRGALTGAAVAVAAVTAALTFSSSLAHLVGTPRLYGQTWDVAIDTQFGQLPPADLNGVMASNHQVADWTYGDHATFTIAGRDVPGIALAPGRGATTWPTLLEGRAPDAPDEIVLGTKTLRAAHLHVGQEVSVASGGPATSMRIVGRAVFPFFGQGSFTPTDLAEGAAVVDATPAKGGFNFVLITLQPGASRRSVMTAVASFNRQLAASGCPQDQACVATAAQRPVDVLNYARVRQTPLALAALLGLLAAATVGHLLVTSVRRRRRELAVLKTLGFVRRQVLATVSWQATVLVAVALAVGLPLGIAGGRWAWELFAGRIGAGLGATVPLVALLVGVPLALALANLVALGPGLLATRLRPAPVLRRE
jgi:ABC-type lipoprotein release transport system permease subunit